MVDAVRCSCGREDQQQEKRTSGRSKGNGGKGMRSSRRRGGGVLVALTTLLSRIPFARILPFAAVAQFGVPSWLASSRVHAAFAASRTAASAAWTNAASVTSRLQLRIQKTVV